MSNILEVKDLVVDFRSIPKMKEYAPVVLDITHSLQFRNEGSSASSGRRKYALNLAKAVTSTSIDALFVEAHQNPDFAKCDGPSAIPFNIIPDFIDQVCEIDNLVKNQSIIQID